MNRTECKNQIFSFKIAVENYRRIVLNNENPLPYDSRIRLIPTLRSQLNQTYGKLEKYIDKIGGGIGQTYLAAFGDGPDGEIISAVSSVIQNLDRIIGRMEGMSDKEFENLLITSIPLESTTIAELKAKINILEFISAILFAICFTLIFAITKIIGITFYWSALTPYLLIFFSSTILIFYVVLPVVEISQKVGLGAKDIWLEFIAEFKQKTKLGKTKTISAFILGAVSVLEFLRFIHIF